MVGAFENQKHNNNIRVNAIAPGLVNTAIIPPVWQPFLDRKDIFAEAIGMYGFCTLCEFALINHFRSRECGAVLGFR